MTDRRPAAHPLVLLLAIALMAGCAADTTDTADQGGTSAVADPSAAAAITSDGLLADVEALSADAMEGRGTGTAGEERAAAYIADRFEAAGLEPVGDSYFQELELVGTKKRAEASSIAITGADGALDLAEGENVAFWSSALEETVDIDGAPLLFVGYGVDAPEFEWNDYGDADVAGKVLLFLNDDPPVTEDGVELFGGEARTYYGRWTYKYEQAMRLGAAGAIVIHTTPSASYGWSVVQHNGIEEHFALDLEGAGYQVGLLGWLDEETSNQIAEASGASLEGWFEQAASRDFVPVDTGFTVSAHIETDIRRITTSNVVGMLEGSDSELAEQVLVFSAHYDHLGTNPDLEDDQVFNGAWDNASGTAGIIALAEAFAATETAPRRSMLFLAAAAEEKGSLGSQWFVANPPFERNRLVGNFNVDMPQIFGLTNDIAAIGEDTNSLGATLRRVASADGITVTGDPRPRAGSFYRSDQVNFAKAGIPALFILPGSDYQQPLDFETATYRDEHYHQAGDEIDERWDLRGLERDLRLLYRTAMEVANADEMPRWNEGNEFEGKWKELHGEE